jgi:hypothetical protein
VILGGVEKFREMAFLKGLTSAFNCHLHEYLVKNERFHEEMNPASAQ